MKDVQKMVKGRKKQANTSDLVQMASEEMMEAEGYLHSDKTESDIVGYADDESFGSPFAQLASLLKKRKRKS